MDYLKDECEDGRRLGFTGKVTSQALFFFGTQYISHLQQAIHPTQVGTIQSTFVPTSKGEECRPFSPNTILKPSLDILRAAKILHQMGIAHVSQIGAFGLELEGGGKEMIDAPMLKQVRDSAITIDSHHC